MSNYYFITSKLNNYVLDIKGASTEPATPIINYPQKSSGTDNQLWTREPTGPKDPAGGQSQYFIKSKLNGNVLDISGNNTAPVTQIISYPQKSSGTDNQVWKIVESSIEGYFYIVSLLNDYVLDVKGNSTAAATPIISYPQKTPAGDNQLWKFVDSEHASGKKSGISAGT
ncbi:RICIN domain-containing protein [Thalassomonas actiniarum]|uniref:RICIN domain-containing protein n=1 Tax=Thalassomonas actiniarum TaxID=485447 RepID=A0AAE9YUB3_9GAMM|nr:RICIN domain-containing protein [Thalassomonas actiniarum]WDE00963.1 RICIN domain-containing protein [Thalassomonas actiniarum]